MASDIETAELTPADVKFNEHGLVPCIVQDIDTKNVLMMAWMNEESLRLTIEQRTTWFYSRSRGKLWHKGEESGNTQELVVLRYDCDADTLLALVRPAGPACHTGNYSCFYRPFSLPGSDVFRNDAGSASAGRGLTDLLGVTVVEGSTTRVRMDMPITADVLQPIGFLHGGATIALLESCSSYASMLGCDLEKEYSFGSHIDIKHLNTAKGGMVHGVAELERVEDLGPRGSKQFWHVEATDDGGRVLSTGTITCRVVSKAYYANKNA